MQFLTLILMLFLTQQALSEGGLRESPLIEEALEKQPENPLATDELNTEEPPPEIKDQIIDDMNNQEEEFKATPQEIGAAQEFQSITETKMSVEKISDFLKKHEAPIHYQDLSGQTFLHHAVLNKNIEVIDFLIKQGIDIHAKNHEGQDALFLASGRSRNAVTIMNRLLSAGADIHTTDNSKNSLLHNAASWGLVENALFLLKEGIETNLKNSNGQTAMALAREEDDRGSKAIDKAIKEVEDRRKSKEDLRREDVYQSLEAEEDRRKMQERRHIKAINKNIKPETAEKILCSPFFTI